MIDFNWKTKGIVLTAPLTKDVETVAEFIDKKLAPAGINLIVMQVRYRYKFESHPECTGFDPLDKKDVGLLLDVCKKNGMRLIPKMNLLGHQSGRHAGPHDGILHGYPGDEPHVRDGLLSAYPEFDETPEIPDAEIPYCRHLCLTNPKLYDILFPMTDELIGVFEADGIHVGCDEALQIGLCPSCRKKSNADLYAGHINKLHEHLSANGKKMYIWGDRLLSDEKTGYGMYESADNGTESAIDKISKDIIICDWHYENMPEYKSVDIFAEKGFKILLSPWKDVGNAKKFIEYAVAHDVGNIEGTLATTWCSSGDLAGHIMYGNPVGWENTRGVAEVLNYLYGIH